MKNTNDCPVCGSKTEESSFMIYCDECGFNIPKKEDHPRQKEVEGVDGSDNVNN